MVPQLDVVLSIALCCVLLDSVQLDSVHQKKLLALWAAWVHGHIRRHQK